MILARAAKIAGSPTVTSRFVQRIAALAGEARWKAVLRARQQLSRTRPQARPSEGSEIAERPAPTPIVEARPRACRSPRSRTGCAIPTPFTPWPYSASLQPARRGRYSARRARPRHRHPRRHRRLHKLFAAEGPADSVKELLTLGEKSFVALADYPEARTFWWPRFVRIAQWFAQWDGKRRAACNALRGEEGEARNFRSANASFTLSRHRRSHRAT